ncbi:hypothetical protein [Bradyrhizobium symbiodeficiens]|uniref:hypothetical protein n=1 Tax=Bradyrhizobium symbiodeficiens TaxID=1404367 RepID=UPI0015F2E99D|nr:hypothetical protein [Bradyrhizobium symbiodeficiens]
MVLIQKTWALARSLRQLPGSLASRLDLIQEALGRIEARQTGSVEPGDLAGAEFKVSSQWGEDGIIEHLVRHVPIERRIFVEFGVQDYREANTRFLLAHRNWSGLVMDGSTDNVAAIRRDDLYWRSNLKAESLFITAENINEAIASHGVRGDIGLLSIDIDGNDYWVWRAIDCISPRIVVAEYNALFGSNLAVSVPYDPAFQRHRAHPSNLYWGCSLAAWYHLAAEKGYALVGCNTAGNNAFFVRRDVLGALPEKGAGEAFRPAKFRESRNPDGSLSFLGPADAAEVIRDLPLVRVTDGAVTSLAQLRSRSSQNGRLPD